MNKSLPTLPQHGNIKYRFDKLINIGDKLILTVFNRGSICTCLKNYNKKNGTSIKVVTRRTAKGLWIQRIA